MHKRQFTSPIILIILLTLIALAWTGPHHPARAQDGNGSGDPGDHTLAYFVPVEGVINDDTPAEDWTFTARADQLVALLVITTGGDLDPVLDLIGPDGVIVARNDDLDSLVRDAGLEALRLPLDGVYTVRVKRYQETGGATAGRYRLTLLPGFARFAREYRFGDSDALWTTPGGDPIPLYQDQLQLRPPEGADEALALPPDPAALDEFYMQADARLFGSTGYTEIGLVFRAQEDQAYRFRINTQGEWTVEYQDAFGRFTLRSWTWNVVLAELGGDPNAVWQIAVLARGDDFTFFVNGVLLGTLTDNRLPEPGGISLLAGWRSGQANRPAVLFDDARITTRLGTTYAGMPLALAAWDSADPMDIVQELADAGQIVPATPLHDLFLFEKNVTAENQETVLELIGSEQAVYGDFLFGGRIAILTNGENNGCGLVYRWQTADGTEDQDGYTLGLAFVDTAGGYGVAQSQDGDLIGNAYDLDPALVGENATVRLLIAVRGDTVVYYVNGALVMQEALTLEPGRVGVALLNYAASDTTCLWTDLWVWPVE